MINFTVKKIIIIQNYIITKILTYYFYQTILEYSNTWYIDVIGVRKIWNFYRKKIKENSNILNVEKSEINKEWNVCMENKTYCNVYDEYNKLIEINF